MGMDIGDGSPVFSGQDADTNSSYHGSIGEFEIRNLRIYTDSAEEADMDIVIKFELEILNFEAPTIEDTREWIVIGANGVVEEERQIQIGSELKVRG